MRLPILVTAYFGYKANERPEPFSVDEDLFDIAEVEDRWHEPDAEYFRVRTADSKRYILRYSELVDEWTLQSGFDGDKLLGRPGIELVTVQAARIREAQSRVLGCEHCQPDDAEVPFDWLLQEVTGRTGNVDFIMTEPAKCPRCMRAVTEKTLVEW